jgi:hypothetical protein
MRCGRGLTLATQAELIKSLEGLIGKLSTRTEIVEYQVRVLEDRCQDFDKAVPDYDKRLSHVERDQARLEKRLVDSDARRFDLWKIIVGALLGMLLTLAGGWLRGRL